MEIQSGSSKHIQKCCVYIEVNITTEFYAVHVTRDAGFWKEKKEKGKKEKSDCTASNTRKKINKST